MLMAICHSAAGGWTKVDDLDQLSELRKETGNVLWAEADVENLTHEDVDLIAEEFGLHPLAVEDAMSTRQRPKIESYEGHNFVVFHQLDEEAGQLEASQIACFVGERYVLTIHSGGARTIEAAKKRWGERDQTEHSSVLLHTLFDVVVDEYQNIADELEQTIEDLEEIALETPRAGLQQQLYRVKQKTSRMRRYVLPMTRLLEWTEDPLGDAHVAEENIPLFRDVHDHLLRMTDQVRNIDDLAQAVIDLTQSEQSNLLNEVSKKLSGYAAIFGVLTLIAGIYGMNFKLVPRDQTLYGFWIAIAMMVAAGAGMYFYFKKKDWL
ncbi:MAG: magnesium transporter [Actinomycetota bacterium]|jgi:magnesium transporter|nr:magnesium transporter [Actinomycetota bacterium]